MTSAHKAIVGVLIGCIVCAFIAVAMFSAGTTTERPAQARKPPVTLDLTVVNDGLRFRFKNNGPVALTNVRAEINGGFEAGVPPLREYVGEASVSALEFTTSDGTRFNPYQKKALQIIVTATTPDGRGTWVGGWK